MSDLAVDAPEFLVVDEFLRSFVDARTLQDRVRTRVDRPAGGARVWVGQCFGAGFGRRSPGDLRFLLDLLTAGGVVQENRGDVRLTRRFQSALRFRDLLEVKLDYAGFTINDFADLFTTLIQSGGGFMGKARLFELFDYRRCFDPTIENYTRARIWMRITSTLTRYEAIPYLDVYDASHHKRMLDVGGNSGEFALQFCRRNPDLRASVFDLPLVCEIGLDHVLPHPEHTRMSFITGDLRGEQLPAGVRPDHLQIDAARLAGAGRQAIRRQSGQGAGPWRHAADL